MAPSLQQGQNGRENNWLLATNGTAAIHDISNHGGGGSARAVKTPFPAASATAPPPAKRIRASASGSDDEFPEWPGRPAAPAAAASTSTPAGTPRTQNQLLTPTRGVPHGFKVTVEGKHEVLVLDDDDDDDDDKTNSDGTARLDGLPSMSAFTPKGSSARELPAKAPQPPAKPVQSVQPVQHVQPGQPARTVQPVQPVQPVRTVQPVQSAPTAQPVQPVRVAQPAQPVSPFQRVQQAQPVKPPQTVQTAQPTKLFQTARPVQPVWSTEPAQPVQPVRTAESPPVRWQPFWSARATQPAGPAQPTQPIQSTQPVQPTRPVQTTQPVQPVQPARPVQTTQPVQPVQPARPVQTTQPVQPVQPARPAQPTQPAGPTQPSQPVQPAQPAGLAQSTRPAQPAQQPRPQAGNSALVYEPLLTPNKPQPKAPSLQRRSASESSSREQTPRLKTEGTPTAQTGLHSVPALVHSSDVRTPQSQQQLKRLQNQNGPLTARRTPATSYFTRFATLPRRPYLQLQHREYVAQNDRTLLKKYLPSNHGGPTVIHVDFTPEEIRAVLKTARAVLAGASPAPTKAKPGKKPSPPDRELKRLVHGDPANISLLSKRCSIKGRQAVDIATFLVDVCSSRGRQAMRLATPRALTLQREDRATLAAAEVAAARSSRLNSLLLTREMVGTLAPGRTRQFVNFPNAFRTLREDSLALCNEWTNCAGDVTTLTWTSEEAFVCGTTTHMDNRNHQYNRQGNLALGSVRLGTLRAYADHRVARTSAIAAAESAGSAEHSSRHDDPWLYTSVVSSDYVASRNLVLTSGFDNTVKLWRINHADNTMALLSNWIHKGKVNFVVASLDEPCLVATASDVSADAVRIYRLTPLTGGGRMRVTYKSLSCSRIRDLDGQPVVTDKWAYFPAAVRWGLAPGTRHLLLVGYSPRGLSDNSDDEHIPEDQRNSGELCLWDGQTGHRWRILGGTSQNVFEVAWHPTQQCFAAATSPVGQIETNVRTQIRIFRPSDNPEYTGQAFSEVQILDCFADDINELALLPNSFSYIYAAAGCTNGRTYVWDTSQGDKPIHILAHGPCVEELSGERISTEDTGVKFVAWGATPDRLYTGSSDGVVKVWNIRSPKQGSPLVRNLLECHASVSFGAFSPSKSRLAVGDASGRVFVLAVEDSRLEKDPEEDAFLSEAEDDDKENDATTTTCRRQKTFRHHPPGIIRHATPPPPLPPPVVLPPRPGLSTPTGVKIEAPSPNGSTDTKSSGAFGLAAATAAAAASSSSRGQNVDPDSGAARAHAYLESGQLVLAPCRTIGAVKGPNYAETNLFCPSFHMNGRPENPLLACYECLQQENRLLASKTDSNLRPFKDVMLADGMLLDDSGMDVDGLEKRADEEDSDDSSSEDNDDDDDDDDGLFVSQALMDKRELKACRRRIRQRTLAQHRRNVARDLDVDALSPETRQALELADRAALLHLDDGIDYGLAFEDDDEALADL